MNTSQLSILGCGWLGLPLAKTLQTKGWQIKGSTTSSEKKKILEAEGIKAYSIELQEEKIRGEVNQFLKDSELLIITIPPGLRRSPNSNFVSKLQKLADAISTSSIKYILYISSTGVFQDDTSMPTYTEHYQFSNDEFIPQQLIQAEQLLLNLPQVQTTVLRFGGLVGEERHPVKFLSGKTGLKNPSASVNLIHLENCIYLMLEIIRQEKFGHIFHGVEQVEFSKDEYYTQKANTLGLPVPKFDTNSNSQGKKISMEWTAQQLGVQLPTKV